MGSSVNSPEDILNLALIRLGYQTRIGSIFEGSKASKAALSIYAQTRDAVLREGDWGFAERNSAMVLIKQAPAGGYAPPNMWSSEFPPPDWLYEVVYPTDALEIRAVKNVPVFVPDFAPRSYVFSVDNDSALTEPSKVILCNVFPGIIVYTGQITDPVDFEPDFVEDLAAALARRLGVLLGNQEAAKMEAADEQASANLAENLRG